MTMKSCINALLVCIRRLVYWIWPPFELIVSNKSVRRSMEVAVLEYEQNVSKWIEQLCTIEAKNLDPDVRDIDANERRRKEQFELKANTLISAVAISSSLLALALSFDPFQETGKDHLLMLVETILLASIVHFLGAAFYAISLLKPQAFYEVSLRSLKEVIDSSTERVDLAIQARKLVNSQLNTFSLTIKGNQLFVAQTLFLRGIVFAGVFMVLLIARNA